VRRLEALFLAGFVGAVLFLVGFDTGEGEKQHRARELNVLLDTVDRQARTIEEADKALRVCTIERRR